VLTHLQVRDFAIIDAVEIELEGGLTVLTGETGAGKSILVDALQLAVGARAGAEAIRHGAERAEVAATFDLRRADPALRVLLEEQSIDADDELVVRRVVTREGKSRAYLNGQQVPVQVLREVGGFLAEIHGQHEFQSLLRAAAQRQLLDAYAGAETQAAEVAALHRERASRAAALASLESEARDRDARLDLLRHQVNELTALALQPDELPALAAERSRLANGGRLAEAARGALDLLYETDSGSAHALAARAHATLRQAAALDARLEALLPGLDAAVIGLADASRELTRYLDGLASDPARQEEVEQRLAAIESAARKHRVPAPELPAKAAELQTELSRLESVEQALESHREAVRAAGRAWHEAARRLSTVRAKAAQTLGRDISARMQTLGMTGGRFEVALEASRTSSSWSRPMPASRRALSPRSPRAASCHACRWRCRSPSPRARNPAAPAWCSTRSTRASAARSRRSSGASWLRSVAPRRCSASRTCRRSRRSAAAICGSANSRTARPPARRSRRCRARRASKRSHACWAASPSPPRRASTPPR